MRRPRRSALPRIGDVDGPRPRAHRRARARPRRHVAVHDARPGGAAARARHRGVHDGCAPAGGHRPRPRGARRARRHRGGCAPAARALRERDARHHARTHAGTTAGARVLPDRVRAHLHHRRRPPDRPCADRAAAASTCSATRACRRRRWTSRRCWRAGPTPSSPRPCARRGPRGSTSGRAGRDLPAVRTQQPVRRRRRPPASRRPALHRRHGRPLRSARPRARAARRIIALSCIERGDRRVSKAFTSEETPEDDDELPDDPSPLPAGSRNYMTPGGFARLRDELDRLVQKERPELVADGLVGRGQRRSLGERRLHLRQEAAARDRPAHPLPHPAPRSRRGRRSRRASRRRRRSRVLRRDGHRGRQRRPRAHGQHRRHRRDRHGARLHQLDLADGPRAPEGERR